LKRKTIDKNIEKKYVEKSIGDVKMDNGDILYCKKRMSIVL